MLLSLFFQTLWTEPAVTVELVGFDDELLDVGIGGINRKRSAIADGSAAATAGHLIAVIAPRGGHVVLEQREAAA